MQQLNREIRTTSYLLHPPLLDESGLSHAIQWYIQGFKERSGLDVELIVSDDFGRLPEDVELSIFRIVQESLTNIHRHSGSKAGRIRLSRDADGISLQIQDYGKGLSAERLAAIKANRAGIGLTGMRERVRHFKGQMDIQSNGTGTTISVGLPVAATQLTRQKRCSKDSKCRCFGPRVNDTLRILIADDSDIVRQGIANVLSSEARGRSAERLELVPRLCIKQVSCSPTSCYLM